MQTQHMHNVFASHYNYVHCRYMSSVLSASTAVTTSIRIGAPTLKVAAIWIFTAFIYDVYWVFLSPYTFGSSVMYAHVCSCHFRCNLVHITTPCSRSHRFSSYLRTGLASCKEEANPASICRWPSEFPSDPGAIRSSAWRMW